MLQGQQSKVKAARFIVRHSEQGATNVRKAGAHRSRRRQQGLADEEITVEKCTLRDLEISCDSML